MINVTKSFLPPIDDYYDLIRNIWQTHHLTNRGELVEKLEYNLTQMFDVKNCLAVANATLGIQMVLKSLSLQGEIITTPFTYIATSSSIVWESCIPVFVDIDPEYLCIDVSKIVQAINQNTCAILATHVFGNPCDVEALGKIGEEYNVKIIYDAAHAFGVKYGEKSIFTFGDVSICSFHATKLFHTAEGGAIFCHSDDLYKKVYHAHNFGHNGYEEFHGLGINGKMSELHAALGLSMLPYINEIISTRREVYEDYGTKLSEIEEISIVKIKNGTEWNYSYLPILFENVVILENVLAVCNSKDIFPRRYFYPSLNTLKFLNPSKSPISEDVASRILCLPLHTYLSSQEVTLIVDTIKEAIHQ